MKSRSILYRNVFDELKNFDFREKAVINFDDVYDSEISLDFHKFRLLEYYGRCGLDIGEDRSTETIGNIFSKHIYDSYNEFGDLAHFFVKDKASELDIPYVGTVRNPRVFQMRECVFDCVTCGILQNEKQKCKPNIKNS